LSDPDDGLCAEEIFRSTDMAKSYTYAVWICAACSLIAAAGIAAGIMKTNALIPILCLLPAAVYESWRTEGTFTRLASWGMLGILIAQAVLLIAKININLSSYAAKAGISLPDTIKGLCNLNVLFPAVVIACSVYLFKRTAGVYTKWLSVVILITSAVILYILVPDSLKMIVDAVKDNQQLLK
jgi:hypothetical protein